MKTIGQVIKYHFIQLSIITLLVVIIVTNISIQIFFRSYLEDKRTQLDQDILKIVEALVEDDTIDMQDLIYLNQFVARNNVHLRIERESQVIFDSAQHGMGHNGMMQWGRRMTDSNYNGDMIYETYPIGQTDADLVIGHNKTLIVAKEDNRFVWAINSIFLLVFLVAVTTVLVSSKYLSKKISKPIVEIEKATNRIALGKYKEVSIKRADTLELFRLGEAVESLASKLENQENLRKRLTTDISHELRSPLAVIRGQIEAMMDGVLDCSKERLMKVNNEVIRLTKLITDMNELSVVEHEMITLNKQKLNLSELIKESCETFQSLFNVKGVDLEIDVGNDLMFFGDYDRIKQIITNLLSNALKYTETGKVKVSLKEKENQVNISVEDSGIGIAEKDLPYIFERFYRADDSRSRNTGGAGIGLSIVKKLIELHDGKIYVTSTLGTGTIVNIVFPNHSA